MQLHELLSSIVQEFGEEVLTENRLKGILSDYSAGTNADRFQVVIARSINDRIGHRLLDLRGLDEADYDLRLNTIKQAFQEDNFFQYGISDYIIDCYLYALGWIETIDEYDEDELQLGTAKAGELSFMEWNGAEYCGNVSKVNERSGFGVCKKVNGSYYAGEWKLDLQAGVGIEVTHEKEKYAGEWSLNRRNGVGTMVRTDGIRYSGEWKNGKMHGVGVLYYPNGERLCARFTSGRIEQGSGVYYLQDGSYILGAMTENGPDGKCLHYKKDGSCETEQWLSGVKQ